MLTSRDQDKALPPGRLLVAKTQIRLTYGALGLLALANAGLIAALFWQSTRDRDVYVVVTDREGVVAEVAQAHLRWTPDKAMWRSEAQKWLRNVRERSLDPGAWPRQVEELVRTTDRSQWQRVDEWLAKSRPTTRNAIDVEITESAVLAADQDGATIFLRWRERKRTRHGDVDTDDWMAGAITIRLAKGPVIVDGEEPIENPFGIYVVGYEFNPLEREKGA